MALTREEWQMWSDTNPSPEQWHHIRLMSHLDGKEREDNAADSIRRLAEGSS